MVTSMLFFETFEHCFGIMLDFSNERDRASRVFFEFLGLCVEIENNVRNANRELVAIENLNQPGIASGSDGMDSPWRTRTIHSFCGQSAGWPKAFLS